MKLKPAPPSRPPSMVLREEAMKGWVIARLILGETDWRRVRRGAASAFPLGVVLQAKRADALDGLHREQSRGGRASPLQM